MTKALIFIMKLENALTRTMALAAVETMSSSSCTNG
jgi:hypothetical protein